MFTASLGIFLFGLTAALAGGYVGAAIGANYAFALTGFAVLASWGIFIATDSTAAFDYLAFGPFMGPHIAFAGGVAAAAYAAKKKYLPSGMDVSSPLAGLGRPSVMMVGALFGAGAYLVQIGISQIPWFGTHTDSVALTVFISALVARLMFGGSLLGRDKFNESPSFLGRIAGSESAVWLKYQAKPSQYLPMGVFFGILAGGASIALATFFPGAASQAQTFTFGISAVIVLFLILGHDMPVQHHITISAGLAAVVYMPILAGQGFAWGDWDSSTWLVAVGALLIAAVAGMLAAFLGEFQAKLFYIRGNTHIDPPAMAIWISNTIIVSSAALFS